MYVIVLQYVAVYCSVIQFDAVWCSNSTRLAQIFRGYVCYSVLQCVAVYCSVLQCVAVCCSVLQCVAVCCGVLQRVAVCCSVWHDASESPSSPGEGQCKV